MPRKPLDEILASPHTGRPETVFPLCVAGKLNAEFDKIDAELDELLETESARRTDDDPKKPGRVGEKPRDPRIEEKNARREELRILMADHMVDLNLRALEPEEWRTWRDANPPREDNQIDRKLGYNIDALTSYIEKTPRKVVVTINDAAYTDEQWTKIIGAAAAGDMWRLTGAVRGLHESAVDVPKSLTDWLATRRPSKTSS